MSESSLTESLRNGAGQRQLRFIDLFAGLGGFHLALRNLGHRCVFASEIDETLRATFYSRACSIVFRPPGLSFFVAMARARRLPTRTTSFLPRVIAV